MQVTSIMRESDITPGRRNSAIESLAGDGARGIGFVVEGLREPGALKEAADALFLDELECFVVEFVADLSVSKKATVSFAQ